jgi:hypothetical protein
VETLLAHYFQPGSPSEVLEAAIDDWIEALGQFPQQAIQAACTEYLREEPRRRPTPGAIRDYAEKAIDRARVKASSGDAEVTDDEKRVAYFAAGKGWMGYDLARDVIIRSRGKAMPHWITSPADRALYALRWSEFNAVLVNGRESGN